ncbi:MAG TPA: hypothetical protein VHC43_15040 [Mycobacteriales bacterium]|nr:hypothetical protein [Mycobacteriales bacterium]
MNQSRRESGRDSKRLVGAACAVVGAFLLAGCNGGDKASHSDSPIPSSTSDGTSTADGANTTDGAASSIGGSLATAFAGIGTACGTGGPGATCEQSPTTQAAFTAFCQPLLASFTSVLTALGEDKPLQLSGAEYQADPPASASDELHGFANGNVSPGPPGSNQPAPDVATVACRADLAPGYPSQGISIFVAPPPAVVTPQDVPVPHNLADLPRNFVYNSTALNIVLREGAYDFDPQNLELDGSSSNGWAIAIAWPSQDGGGPLGFDSSALRDHAAGLWAAVEAALE